MVDKRSSGFLVRLQEQALEDSERWFGDQPIVNDLAYIALCLGGEVGEVQNLIKKAARGSIKTNDPVFLHDLAMEIADVFTYLINLTGTLKIDLEALYYVKRDFNHQRFTADRDRRDLERLGADGTGVLGEGDGEARDR